MKDELIQKISEQNTRIDCVLWKLLLVVLVLVVLYIILPIGIGIDQILLGMIVIAFLIHLTLDMIVIFNRLRIFILRHTK